ncbi:hypothetical protein [Actinokineospora sp. NPDC004072]
MHVDLPADPASAGTVALVAQPTATPPPGPADPGGQGEDFGKSSPLGFLILILFLIAVAFLVRSMSKHLKRIPESFDQAETPDSPPPAKV